MSLPALAVRWATVMLLRGQTVADARVLDAPIDPVERASALAGPVIAVYTSDATFKPRRKSLLSGGIRRLDLRLQLLLPAEVCVAVPSASGATPITIDVRAEGGATLLDVLWRQIERALLTSPSPWRQLWCDLVSDLVEVKAEDLVIPVENGVEFVAREVSITLDTIDSPEVGAAEHATWPQLVALMRQTSELRPLADWIALEITQPGAQPGWMPLAMLAGLSRAEADALGLGVLPGGEDLPPATRFTIETPRRTLTVEGAPGPGEEPAP